MLEQARSSCSQIYLKTDVSIDTFPIFIVFYFVEPDVSGLDSMNDGVSSFSSGVEPSFFCKVDASFNPGKFSPISPHELKDIAVVNVKVTYKSAVLISATSSKCFILCRVDFCK